MNKEDNFKEKFKQALISTVRVISNDYQIYNNKKEKLNEQSLNIANLENINQSCDMSTMIKEALDEEEESENVVKESVTTTVTTTNEPKDAPKKKKKKSGSPFLLIFLLLLIGGGIYYYIRRRKSISLPKQSG